VLARVLGCSVRHISQLEAEGAIVPVRRGRAGRASQYDLLAVVPAYIGRLTTAAPQTPRDAYWRARAAREEIDLARARGDLVPRGLVVHEGRAYTAAWASMVRTLAPRLEQAGLIPATARRDVLALLREILTEIANWRTSADLDAATRAEETPLPTPYTTTEREDPR
jgi:phage terminase Nu1 subunit (DNA packaging protein)